MGTKDSIPKNGKKLSLKFGVYTERSYRTMELCSFGNICERDMDMLFMEAIVTDSEFAKYIISKTDLKNKAFKSVSVELSKVDSKLGESDITNSK